MRRYVVPDTKHISPQFKSSLLKATAAAFTKRRKAIRRHTETFEVERDLEQAGFEPPEKLTAKAATIGGSVQLRLSVWPDGAMWFWAGRPSKQGWTFQIAFHGSLADAVPTGVVSRFEESLGLVYKVTAVSDVREPLMALWRDVEPQLDRAV